MSRMSPANMPITVHIINHTHWDREWFLTSAYTSRWIPGLVDKLEQLAAHNPAFRFWFDGQTLVVEDLLEVAPDYAPRIQKLVREGHLSVGPYYCQPDWQLTGGELLIRNLQYGQQDLEKLGAEMKTGWLVDTFGHISQAPQIHRLFGIDSVYVWRGVPQIIPYFRWQGPDGSTLFTINLFGGYRNLYGVTHAPAVARKRLLAEVEKLRPYYPTPDIPLFDGYDLEDDPEDPLSFFEKMPGIGPDLVLRESTPALFAQEMASKGFSLPTITGELNSGKYGAIFPGTLSARTYLKIMAHDCQQMLFHLCEPLAVMASFRGRPYEAAQYEAWGRALLQNAVHDCICGVSIDQVHEKMEYIYRQVFDDMQRDIQASVESVIGDFAPGLYAVGLTPFATDQWALVDDHLLHSQTDGVGVWPVREKIPVERLQEPVDGFTWRNEHFSATVDAAGIVHVDGARLGALVISEEHGDTYSDEGGEQLGVIQATSPLILEQRSDHHAVLRFSGAWSASGIQVTATVRLIFDPSPTIRWQIDLDSRGSDLRVEMLFETARQGKILAGMPFDVVERPVADTDLMPRHLPEDLTNLLLGQREVGQVATFPFHDFVALSNGDETLAIMAKGVHSYTADEKGNVRLMLRRAVEWLTRSELEHRVGDAGPFFYVPDARCERTVHHEIGVAFGSFGGDSMEMQRLNAAYQHPPLIVQTDGPGSRTSWRLLRENAPLGSLHMGRDIPLVRLYNPTSQIQPLARVYRQADVWGDLTGEICELPPGAIATVLLPEQPVPEPAARTERASVHLLARPSWRVGENHGAPDPAVLEELRGKIAAIDEQLKELQTQMQRERDEASRLRLQHRIYALQREQAEFRLSLVLNQRKLTLDKDHHAYLFQPDEEIAAIGLELNRLRIKRRIYDYVVASL